MTQQAVDLLPRHMQASASGPSSVASESPVGTPPTASSQVLSPANNNSSAGSSTHALPSTSVPPSSPPLSGGNSSNRFGLALGNLIQRRPRGFTNPSSNGGRSPGARSPGAGSPSSELPPSPGGSERAGGYGFPALRRTLSKRAASTSTANGAGSPAGEGSRSRARRSSSQPPVPAGQLDAGEAFGNRPRTASSAADGGSAAAHGPLNPPAPAFAALSASTSLPSAANLAATPTTESAPNGTATNSTSAHHLRLVPHLESSRSHYFDPIDRDLAAFAILRVGRFTDRSHSNATNPDLLRIAFKSKVVSRGHAEIWSDDQGKFFIKDTKSSSGTFLNHIRLSGPNTESRAFPLKDGDVLQLGVDYQGGTEEIYRCVKMRVELNRGWQRGMNSFNTAALAQLRALGGGGAAPMEATGTGASGMTTVPSLAQKQKQAQAATTSITDCCICLYPVTVCQALFIAPCSHVTHFKCIRPLVLQNYPGFCCPLCRTYADLEADVEIEPWEPEVAPTSAQPETVDEEPEREEEEGAAADDEPMSSVEEADEPTSRVPSIRSGGLSASRRSSFAALGPDGLPLAPFQLSSIRRASRPSSIAPSVNEEGTPSTTEATGSSSIAMAIDAHDPTDNFDATTPANSTFLSTLADSGASFLPRQFGGQVASLDNILAEAGPSVPVPRDGLNATTTTPTHRASFGSEDDTDAARDDEGGVKVLVVGKGKGKGKEREDTSLPPAKKVKDDAEEEEDVRMDGVEA